MNIVLWAGLVQGRMVFTYCSCTFFAVLVRMKIPFKGPPWVHGASLRFRFLMIPMVFGIARITTTFGIASWDEESDTVLATGSFTIGDLRPVPLTTLFCDWM